MYKPIAIAVAAAGLAGLAMSFPVLAQEKGLATAADRLEITMTLLPDKAADAADITRHIELPSAPGPTAADGKRPDDIPGADHGKGEGLEKAAEARDLGRQFGQDTAEQARENRENAGRGDDHPSGPPVDVPVTPPGPPEVPTPPQKP